MTVLADYRQPHKIAWFNVYYSTSSKDQVNLA